MVVGVTSWWPCAIWEFLLTLETVVQMCVCALLKYDNRVSLRTVRVEPRRDCVKIKCESCISPVKGNKKTVVTGNSVRVMEVQDVHIN